VELDVVNTYNDYATGLKALEVARAMVEAATENEAVARGSYQAGNGDIIRLLDAQARLVSANQQLIAARYGLYTYHLALLRATGELFRENIEGAN
jgi:outer membrane protein TolC